MSTLRSRRKQAPAEQVPEDAEMEDAPAAAVENTDNIEATGEEDLMQDKVEEGDDKGEEAYEEDEEEDETQRVKLLPGSTPTAASFEFLDEGHTLGNSLRYIIMKNPDVEFCAYTIPHPSEAKMNIRIQTYEGTALQALEKGLHDLQDLCDVVEEKYWTARNEFVAAATAEA
ncbi:DNA-directed RNA polymerase 1 and 3 polypeptide [Grosmannia clavigera kw1407]|uniref:DNA-directed RNA polymerase 1 and 3 polypeptide n=1 Tax=Grosmannia clavigera (strain kw1407 / UAMH 11150) TaxID=655863 RepID=F0XH13_GROCL|nr:DNA-directed RNA polymerase 1 and 3 polypeptide [Grosmannia clavigera kw1407]EFX02852.1 DNA-directed RNA polymerase 1 and 3 polypeptide [Grosmannia clavigera kw1407]